MEKVIDRRAALGLIGAGFATPLFAQSLDLGLGNGQRAMTTAFPGKGAMILQRTRAPLLETPLEAFDGNILTPNDRFFVRWHYADIPLSVDVNAFRLRIGGAVRKPLALSLADLQKLPQVELVAVNQCSGNSRGHFFPRVPGAQWSNGAMGNARWGGVRLKDLLDLAGMAPGAVQARFSGLDRPPGDAPWFAKSLDMAHALDGEVMVATHMNGEPLPMLNGFPMRLIVPGWYSTYWVKALDKIEILTAPDTGYWMEKAYRIPTTPGANVIPGAKDFPTVPINRMVPRAFFTNMADGTQIVADSDFYVRGLAIGGDVGVRRIDLSMDGGKSWKPAQLGQDLGKYSFRPWEMTVRGVKPGNYHLLVRCTNNRGEVQPMTATWNPTGFMRNPVEQIAIRAA